MDTKIDQLKQIIPEKYILRQEPMKNHTTFRIGGPADIFVAPENMEEIKAVSRFAKEEGIPLFVLGNGSNLLVADDGMDGIVLQIYKNYSGIEVRGNELIVKAGTLLSSTSRAALNEELTGFEFAGGIPGTFGGAVVMNAGAYGGEMVQVLKEVTVLTKEGEIKTTGELVDIIKAAIPASARREGPHPAKRTFQAIRIEVNSELEQLENAIDRFCDVLRPGGRLCIITFHSLEDRIVKEAFQRRLNPCTCPKEFPVCVCGKVTDVVKVTGKPIISGEEELTENPRARSAKLRIIEKKR